MPTKNRIRVGTALTPSGRRKGGDPQNFFQMLKTILFSVLSCSLLGLSQWQHADPGLVRTDNGMILIPASAGVSESDAAAVLGLLSAEEEPVAHLAFNIDGKSGMYGNFTMEELAEVGRDYNTDLGADRARKVPLLGFIFFRETRKCHNIWGDTKCDNTMVLINQIATGHSQQDLATNVEGILDKYGYIEIASQGKE